MRPTMATVMSPRPWEARLVAAAVETGLVRLVARCYNPHDVLQVNAVVVGSETPWITASLIARWRSAHISVVGIFPQGDRVAIDLFCRSYVDQLFVETAEPTLILRTVRDLTSQVAPTSG